MEAYLGAILRGNPEGVGSAFDLTTDEGRAAAKAGRKEAEIQGSIRDIIKAKVKQLGGEGSKATEDAIAWRLLIDEKGLQDYLRKEMKIYIGEDGDTAVAYVPYWKQYVKLRRKADKWFIEITKDQASAINTFTYVADHPGGLAGQQIDELKRILMRAKTVDELKAALEKFKEEQETQSRPPLP
jgi:hypothetical protein